LRDVFAKFRVSIRTADFVEYSKDAGRKVVTLRKLEGIVDQIWKENKEYFTDENTETIRKMLSHALGEAEKIHYTSNLENMVCLSIQTLVWSLGKFFTLELHISSWRLDILEQRVLKAGWCKYWTQVYCLEYTGPLLHYLSGLPRSSHSGHEACTASSCTAHNVRD